MAVAVVETTSGSAANAEAVTVTFADAVAGDLILFSYSTYFKEFGNGDWLANSGWSQIPPIVITAAYPWYTGMVFHIVQSGETSWTPVNDDSNTVEGIWIAQRVQGHSVANPILNYFVTAYSDPLYPNTVPCASNASVLGMMFTNAGVPSGGSTALSGGVGSTPWTVATETDSHSNIMCVGYVAAADNITPATGTWTWASENNAQVNEWVVQPAPGSPTEAGSYILKEEVVSAEFSGSTGNNLSLNISWTPTPGNYLLTVFCASRFFPTAPIVIESGWTALADTPDSGFLIALRTIQEGDGTAYTVANTFNRGDWYCYVYELTDVTYAGIADGAVTSPDYTTPFEGGTGQTLCFFPVTVGTVEANCWPQYAMLSGQIADGSGTSSINAGGVDYKFVSASSHLITENGGQAGTGLSATTNPGYGATIVFDITSGPVGTCSLGSEALNFRGDVSGLFYVKTDLGSEVVPTLYVDSTLSIDNGTMSPSGQMIAQDGQWIDWLPDSGPLSITFPARTLWVVTSQAKGSPPSIPVYATSKTYPPWKQTCTE